MKRWNDFLESLATGGGAILALMFFVVLFGFVSLHIMHHSAEFSDQMVTTFTGLLTGFAGALLGALTARSKPLNGTTTQQTDTVTQTQTTSVPDATVKPPAPTVDDVKPGS